MCKNNNYVAKQEEYFFGKNKRTNELIYLNMPEWTHSKISGIPYWKFGYLSSAYHLYDYINNNGLNLYDELLEDYELNEKIKDNLWSFCEITHSIYYLKEVAKIYNVGRTKYTDNPCSTLIINKNEAERINDIVLPALFKELENLLSA